MLEVKIFTLYPDFFPGPLDIGIFKKAKDCLLYTSPSPRDLRASRMPSSA